MKKVTIMALTAGMIIAGGCAKKNDSGKIAAERHQQILQDSIKAITTEIDSCDMVAGTLSDQVNNLLRDFTAVNNNREVEGYTIFNGWKKRYPLKATGVVARINAGEQLELVAALSGGVFDQISVTADEQTANTAVVPNDQALNYRREGLTTVMFTGKEADDVAKLIADNELNPIKVNFLNGGKVTGSWQMPGDYAKMIAMTSMLYSAHKEQNALERRSVMLSEKVKILRTHLSNGE